MFKIFGVDLPCLKIPSRHSHFQLNKNQKNPYPRLPPLADGWTPPVRSSIPQAEPGCHQACSVQPPSLLPLTCGPHPQGSSPTRRTPRMDTPRRAGAHPSPSPVLNARRWFHLVLARIVRASPVKSRPLLLSAHLLPSVTSAPRAHQPPMSAPSRILCPSPI